MSPQLYYRRVLYSKRVNENRIKGNSSLSFARLDPQSLLITNDSVSSSVVTLDSSKTSDDMFLNKKEFPDLGRLRLSAGLTFSP